VLVQVGAGNVPLKVCREVHPRRDVDVTTKTKAEGAFSVPNLLDRLEECELIIDPFRVGSVDSLPDLTNDGNNSLFRNAVGYVSRA